MKYSLVDEAMVDTIRTTGNAYAGLPDRADILKEFGLPCDREAENVIISGCLILSTLTSVLCSLSRIFEEYGFSHTFLSREYCCGNYLYRPAIKNRDERALSECRQLSREFIGKNINRAKSLGAKRIVIFCSPCYPIYKHSFPDEEIIFYSRAIDEIMEPMRFKREIDYYAGCYRLHRRLSPVSMDLKSSKRIFSKLKGLKVHNISAPKCCFTPEGLSHMMENVRTDLLVHLCTGCYGQAVNNMQSRGVKILMLPELVENAMDQRL
jgi:hypothetical protein